MAQAVDRGRPRSGFEAARTCCRRRAPPRTRGRSRRRAPASTPSGSSAARVERGRIERHGDLPRPAADDGDLRDVRDLLDRFPELAGQLPEAHVVVARTPQRERHHGHVVDRPRLDDRAARRRAAARTGDACELLVEAHERALFVLADEEADDDHRLPDGSRWSRGTRRRALPTAAVRPAA